jgi:hypothetical protein
MQIALYSYDEESTEITMEGYGARVGGGQAMRSEFFWQNLLENFHLVDQEQDGGQD